VPTGAVQLGTVRRVERTDFLFGHVTVTDTPAPSETTWPVTAVRYNNTGKLGNNTADLDARVSLEMPADLSTGTYTGTVTHQVG
jgi:hypothetical protein